MHVEAERGEEGHEEGLGGVRIPHPDGLRRPSSLLPLLLQGRHHPVLHAVLPPDPARGGRPRGQRGGVPLGAGGGGRGHHGDVEARGEVVHEDAERRGGRAPGGEGAEVEEDAAGGGGAGRGGEVDDGGGEREGEEQQPEDGGHRADARRGGHGRAARRRPRWICGGYGLTNQPSRVGVL